MELRAQKPLEKIKVKELCDLACINKSTFYAHYQDIYALANAMEDENAFLAADLRRLRAVHLCDLPHALPQYSPAAKRILFFSKSVDTAAKMV